MNEFNNKLKTLINFRNLANGNQTQNVKQLDEELLAAFNNNQIEETHGDYLWLLIFDLLIFIGLTFISYQASLKISENVQDTDDPNGLNKLKFIKGLTYANLVRALSLIVIITLGNSSGNNPTSWFNYIAHVFPAFVFVSAYIYLLTILADSYYSDSNYNNHLAKPAFLLVVVSSYIVLALIALISFASKNFKSFAYSSEFLIGLLYMLLGAMIIYYGEKINKNMERNDQDRISINDTKTKLNMISMATGGLFLTKSFFGLLTALHLFGDIYPVSLGPNIWDFFMFLLTEIAPTVIFMINTRKKMNIQNFDYGSPTEGMDSKTYEMNQLKGDIRGQSYLEFINRNDMKI